MRFRATPLLAAAAATIFVLSMTGKAAAEPPVLERAPYLQNVTPTSAVIRWRTTSPTTTRVRWGLAADELHRVVDASGTRTEHVVQLTGLTPGAEIFYAVGSWTEKLAGGDADHVFGTPPPAGRRRPLRIWVTGDHGACGGKAQGCRDAAAVRDGYLAWARGRRADFWLVLGDNAYPSGTDAEFTTGHFAPFAAIMRSAPFWSAPGNHEFASGADSPTQSGPYYDSHSFPTAGEGGGAPSGTEAYYSFDWGNVHVVSLDSYDTNRDAPADPVRDVCAPGQGGAMYRWLCADLAAADQDFTIAIWHHPPHSKGTHDSDRELTLIQMRERFLPVLERYGVDLVLTGHSHGYERSVLLDGYYQSSEHYSAALHALDAGDGDPGGDGAYRKPRLGPDPHAGTVHVVAGNGSKVTASQLGHPAMVRGSNSLGSVVIDVVGRELDARLIGVAGEELDRFRIVKGEPLPACSDGIDQDGDGRIDHPDDPGCFGPETELENPACDDDLDDDGDGRLDWDGGPASGEPDPACLGPWWFSESFGACGLGAELALVLLTLLALRRRQEARRC